MKYKNGDSALTLWGRKQWVRAKGSTSATSVSTDLFMRCRLRDSKISQPFSPLSSFPVSKRDLILPAQKEIIMYH
uniref:Macaca fascicularis brain cDNA, clone: QtrA-17278 n=1 Tax=Macaca fascicularis TaxID=9541 RepID=I7GM26_MACFA|nr:unnamed protein product [Macaca fascicularis]